MVVIQYIVVAASRQCGCKAAVHSVGYSHSTRLLLSVSVMIASNKVVNFLEIVSHNPYNMCMYNSFLIHELLCLQLLA